jgi:antitoxin ParD1/3/4
LRQRSATFRPPALAARQVSVGKVCHAVYFQDMGSMNVSLPDSLKSFVDEQVARRDCATSSEYVRERIRIDQDRQRLRGLLLEGAESLATVAADDAYFNGLRDRVQQTKSE